VIDDRFFILPGTPFAAEPSLDDVRDLVGEDSTQLPDEPGAGEGEVPPEHSQDVGPPSRASSPCQRLPR